MVKSVPAARAPVARIFLTWSVTPGAHEAPAFLAIRARFSSAEDPEGGGRFCVPYPEGDDAPLVPPEFLDLVSNTNAQSTASVRT
jgi:hypothetical protein